MQALYDRGSDAYPGAGAYGDVAGDVGSGGYMDAFGEMAVVVYRGAGVDDAVFTEGGEGADNGSGADDGSGTESGVRADGGGGVDDGLGVPAHLLVMELQALTDGGVADGDDEGHGLRVGLLLVAAYDGPGAQVLQGGPLGVQEDDLRPFGGRLGGIGDDFAVSAGAYDDEGAHGGNIPYSEAVCGLLLIEPVHEGFAGPDAVGKPGEAAHGAVVVNGGVEGARACEYPDVAFGAGDGGV